jgi:predicted metal-dependent HD superfamily phosphohydrolase
MSEIKDQLITRSEHYLSTLFAEKLPPEIIYHDFKYSATLRKYAETIGEETGLDPDEMNLLRLSALFHSSGFVNYSDDWIEGSIRIASDFLERNDVDPSVISQIAEVIRATRVPQAPKDKIAGVLCDAVMMFLSADDALAQFDRLYDETAWLNPGFQKRLTYEKRSVEFFMGHSYFTDYGKQVLQPKKEAFLLRLNERMKHRKLMESKKEEPAREKFVYSRGVETMFRITARNQINLNSIADNKSNILISVNAIIISIIITMLAGNIGTLSNDIVPIIIFLVVCLVTIIIAILSTRPNIVTRKFTDEDLKNKKVDLIFFGNFIKLDYDDYENEVKAMMKDDDHLYSTLLKNQYELGKILSKKFRLVRMAYNVFMVGIIITVIAFLVKYLIF